MHHDEWVQAMEAKLAALQHQQIWELVDLPLGKKPICSRWVYEVKRNCDSSMCECKARLVVKGCAQ